MSKDEQLAKMNKMDYILHNYKLSFEGARGTAEYLLKQSLDETTKYYTKIILNYLNLRYGEIKDFKDPYEQALEKIEEIVNTYDDWDLLKDIQTIINEVKMKPNKQQLEYDLTDNGTGKKYDSGKPLVGALCRVFPRALLGIGACIEFGTHKYPNPANWKLVDNAFERYQDSMMRHFLKFQAGEVVDKETNLPHLCHAAWNALAILELYLMNNKETFNEMLLK